MPDEFKDKRFLVVDDFADMRSAVRGILRSLGVNQIDQARDGNEAISLLESKAYDVILCDYNLGSGKDGQQVLEEARLRSLIGVDCIFIMITAENTREMVLGAVEYSPDSYLSKPFTKELLKTRLSKLFERKADLAKVNKALRANNFSGALHEIDALVAAKPKNLAELIKLKAEICLSANRLDEAMAIYEQILAEREIPWARIGFGKVLLRRKDYAGAEEVFRTLIEHDRNLIPAYDWLAKAQIAQGQLESAEQTLAAGAKLSPRGLKRQQWLGEVALGNGNSTIAEAAFERAVNLAKHSVLNHPSLYSGLAQSKSHNGKHDEALKTIARIAKSFPDQTQGAFYAASATAMIKRNQGDLAGAAQALAEAEKHFAAVGEEAQGSALALDMARTYAQLDVKDKAAELLQRAISNNHDEDELLMEVRQLCQTTNLDYDADQAISEIQKDVVKTNNAGVRLIKQGDYNGAITLLCAAADNIPGNKTINLNAAKAIIMKVEKLGANADDIQLVRKLIERVQRVAPDDWRLADIRTRLRQLATKTD